MLDAARDRAAFPASTTYSSPSAEKVRWRGLSKPVATTWVVCAVAAVAIASANIAAATASGTTRSLVRNALPFMKVGIRASLTRCSKLAKCLAERLAPGQSKSNTSGRTTTTAAAHSAKTGR